MEVGTKLRPFNKREILFVIRFFLHKSITFFNQPPQVSTSSPCTFEDEAVSQLLEFN